jgi:hypothetical protein
VDRSRVLCVLTIVALTTIRPRTIRTETCSVENGDEDAVAVAPIPLTDAPTPTWALVVAASTIDRLTAPINAGPDHRETRRHAWGGRVGTDRDARLACLRLSTSVPPSTARHPLTHSNGRTASQLTVGANAQDRSVRGSLHQVGATRDAELVHEF